MIWPYMNTKTIFFFLQNNNTWYIATEITIRLYIHSKHHQIHSPNDRTRQVFHFSFQANRTDFVFRFADPLFMYLCVLFLRSC